MNIDNNSPEENPFEEFKPDFQEEQPLEEEEGEPKSNKTFWLVVGVIASVFVLAVVVIIIFVIVNRNRAGEYTQQAAQINAQNTAIAQQATDIFVQEIRRMTEKAVMPPTWTPTVVVVIATSTPQPTATSGVLAEGDSAARTATVAAFLTAVAQGSPTVPPTPGAGTLAPTSTALPNTGFMDEVGLPGMFGVALALIFVVLVVRRLRLSTSG
jgi:LPXTG-motif cell wall-anchored protein